MTASRFYRIRLCAALMLAPLLGLPLAGCSRVTLISAYDEQIDHSASELQQRMDAFLTMGGMIPCSGVWHRPQQNTAISCDIFGPGRFSLLYCSVA